MPFESGKRFWKLGGSYFSSVGSSFTIFVDNLPSEVGVPWFRKFFSKFGKIAEVFIPAKRSNRTGNRFGYVRFVYQEDVAFAIANANGLWVGRRNLLVKRASYDRGMVSTGSNPQMMGIPLAEKQKDIVASKSLNFQPIATSWLQTSAVVKLMTLSTPDLVLKAFHEFKMKEIQVRSLGGMYMIITFQSKDDRDQAMANSVIRSWFSSFEPWNGDAASLSRLVWINCRGMPLNIWCHNSFKRIGEMWGEFIALDVETIHGLSYDVGRLLIVTEKQERIDEWINICVRGRNYKVKVWEEECKDPFNDFEILKIASQQCSVKVYKPKLKLNISKDDDGLTGDKNVESQGFDESNAVANNHHADASYNEAINATLEKDQHLILPKPVILGVGNGLCFMDFVAFMMNSSAGLLLDGLSCRPGAGLSFLVCVLEFHLLLLIYYGDSSVGFYLCFFCCCYLFLVLLLCLLVSSAAAGFDGYWNGFSSFAVAICSWCCCVCLLLAAALVWN
ncbi:hypothetical protein Vadar_010007 [Vaccinium darrowii]|nr:hypothetical protein Vadar_010007 [Vaccinium darrowii]